MVRGSEHCRPVPIGCVLLYEAHSKFAPNGPTDANLNAKVARGPRNSWATHFSRQRKCFGISELAGRQL